MKAPRYSMIFFLLWMIGLLPGLCYAANPAQAQNLDELPDFEAHRFVPADENQLEDDNYILRSVHEVMKEPLRLGWSLPSNQLILDQKFEKVTVYGPNGEVSTAKLEGALSKEELGKIRRQFRMACEPYSDYFVYGLSGPRMQRPERTLVTVMPLPEVRLVDHPVSLTGDELDKAISALDGKGRTLHRYSAFRTADGQFTYSFHAFYDPSAKVLVKSGIVLQGTVARSLAISMTKYDPAQNCKGCGLPTLDDPIERVYDPIGLIQTSLFPNPLVLLRGATPGSRSLSIMTFDGKAHLCEVWSTESLADCGDR